MIICTISKSGILFCITDNNPLNNLVSNLKWGTYKENTQQMMREGRNKGQFVSKLSQEQLKEVVRL